MLQTEAFKIEKRSLTNLGWKRSLRGDLVKPPAMSRDTFNHSKLVRALSNLSLNFPRGGAPTSFLTNLFGHALYKKVHIFNINLPS